MTQASDREAAERYAKRFTDFFPMDAEEVATNQTIIEAVSAHFLAGIAHARREMEGEIADYKKVLETVIGSHHEAFLYEKRESSNIPGSLDQPRNAYNMTLALAEMAREALNKYGSKE